MSFKNLNIPLTISTALNENPYEIAIVPFLKIAKTYDRGVAYFHSEWIDLAKEGLIEFVENGGKMRLITSIQVNQEELNAFIKGEEAKVNKILKKEIIDDLENNLANSSKKWTLNYLSWLIATEVLEVRISVHLKSDISIYHDKVSILGDGNDYVCLHGSLNDSKNALINQETINVFASWHERENERIENHKKIFESTWNNKINDYLIVKMPEFIKLEFEKRADYFNPYKLEKYVVEEEETSYQSVKSKFVPREYQNDAVQALKDNDWSGILNMATGTGKTLTSLFAVDEIIKERGPQVICIVAPQIHLIEQWISIVEEKYPNDSILNCSGSKTNWASTLNRHTYHNRKNNLFLFTSYKTLIDNTFQNANQRFKNNFVYIFDECHKLGSTEIIKNIDLNKEALKIGLSATPTRWLDNEGNIFIESVIGKTVYEFSLEKAIKENFLVPYDYHIYFSELIDEEIVEFISITEKISKAAAMVNAFDVKSDKNEPLKRLLNKRAKIAKGALNKTNDFINLFLKQKEKKHTIVYVFDEQVENMVELIKEKFSLNVHGIIAKTPTLQRNKILKGFNDGEIDVLVAIQCLDEGIDIPNCKYAYILASSTNPREFIQRRGRVLRKSPLKTKGIIHDFVTIAPDTDFFSYNEKRSVIKRELARVAEFVRTSNNKDDTNLIIYLTNIKSTSDYIDLNPWDIINTISENEREEEENE